MQVIIVHDNCPTFNRRYRNNRKYKVKFSTKASSKIPRKAFPEHLENSQFHNYIIWGDTLWLGFNGDAADRVEKWFLDKQNSLSKLGFLLKVSEVSNRIPGYRLAIKIDSQILLFDLLNFQP